MSSTDIYTFDVDEFRVQYKAFADDEKYPDDLLQMNFDTGSCYVTNKKYGWMQGDCRYEALTLMTAHLTALADLIAAGKQPGFVQSATIDKVTVNLTPPLVPTAFRWWLMTTPYGAQLSALLGVFGVGGFYVGGLPETLGFRKVAGVF